MKPRPRGREPARDELARQRTGQPVEDEAEGLEVLDGGFDGQREPEPFGGVPWPERLELLAAGPGVDPRAFLAEPGDQRGAGELGDRPDLPQPEPREPGADIRVGGEESRRAWGEEVSLATRCDEDRGIGPGKDGGDGRGEPGPGDPGPDPVPSQRRRQALDEDRLGTP